MAHQTRLSDEQIIAIIRVGDAVAAPLFAAHGENFCSYDALPPHHQENLRTVVRAQAEYIIAYQEREAAQTAPREEVQA